MTDSWPASLAVDAHTLRLLEALDRPVLRQPTDEPLFGPDGSPVSGCLPDETDKGEDNE